MLTQKERSFVLEESSELEKVYTMVAHEGDSKVPENAEDEVDFHYVCFVRSHINRRLYELDGDRKGPRNTGFVLDSDDVLVPESLNLIRDYINREGMDGKFGLLALGYESPAI